MLDRVDPVLIGFASLWIGVWRRFSIEMINLLAQASRRSLGVLPPAVPTPVATYFGVNIVDLNVRPDKKVKKGKAKIKQRYLRKFPAVRKDQEGNVIVDGISNKQHPCPIAWKEPEKIERIARHEDASGDMGSMLELVGGQVDLKLPKIDLDGCDLLKDAPEEVKKSCSLEFANNYNLTAHVKKELVKKVQDHKLDVDSLSVAIASMTVYIRNDQEQLEEEKRSLGKRNKQRAISLANRIRTRLVLLRWLRQKDYKKFEWLLEALNIVYKPRPFEHEEIQRRVHQSRLTALWCDELRLHKLDQYKVSLDQQQPAFLREKAEKFKWIMKEEQELGMEATVKQEEIDQLLKRADDLEAKLKGMPEREYHIFDPHASSNKDIFIN